MPRAAQPKSKRPTSSSSIEWVGGLAELPLSLAEGASKPPVMALWLELPSGCIIASAVGSGEAPLQDLERTLRAALEKPLVGKPRKPSRVRIAGLDGAVLVRKVLGSSIPVLVEPTPEIRDAAEGFLAHLERSTRTQYVLDASVPEPTLQALFGAARDFANLSPWRTLSEGQTLQVDVPAHGVAGAAAQVIGQAGMSRALLLFPSARDLTMYEAMAALMHQDPESMPDDMGSTVLSVSFDEEQELDPAAVAQMVRRGYPLASRALIPVVEQRDSSGAPQPLTPREIRLAHVLLSGVTEFLRRHGAELARKSPATLAANTRAALPDGEVEVSVRSPHAEYERVHQGLAQMADLAQKETAQARAAGPKVGRNDPCPCGSGKKHKKCCATLQAVTNEPAPTPARGHELDHSLAQRVHAFAVKELGNRHRALDAVFHNPDEALQLGVPLSVYRTPVDGQPAAAHYLARHGARLSAVERAWLERQMSTVLRAWEVLEVVEGERMTVRDLLTGDTHLVQEKSGTRTLTKRDVILGRMLEDGGVWRMVGCHPRTLGASETAEVIAAVRKGLGLKRNAQVTALLDVAAEPHWISAWEARVAAVDRAHQNRKLLNTDGEEVLLTCDHFDLAIDARAEVEKRIQQLPWATPAEAGESEEERVVTFLKPGNRIHKSWENTVYGRVVISPKGARIETNSVNRADTLRARLEGICADLVRHRLREHQDPRSPRQGPAPQAAEPPPELQALVAQEVQRMLCAWPDQSLPALDGKTPREAVRTKRGRERVDLLLRDFERQQGHAPQLPGFDLGWLRQELRLPE